MKTLFFILLGIAPLVSQETPTAPPSIPPATVPAEDPPKPSPAEDPTAGVGEKPKPIEEKPIEEKPAEEKQPPALSPAEDPEKLFQKGFSLGKVADRPSGAYRRLVQRTVMIGEEPQPHRAILTFDDQILPTDRGHSSAMDIAKDLQPRGVRAIFFANVPAVSEKSLIAILRRTSDREKQKEQVLKLLNSQRSAFVKGIRDLLKLKKGEVYICEVFNHTAFHQNMGKLKKGTARMDLCKLGIRFIEGCLDEAYAAERPGTQRLRYFRFPFLAEPKDRVAKTEINELFTELGLISLGETQDSKDFDNQSSTRAYKSLKAAFEGKRYSVRHGAYGVTESPIALFHTKTWSKIKKGVLQFLDEHPAKS